MKKLILAGFTWVISSAVFAQYPPGAGSQTPASTIDYGKIKGEVIDEKGQPVPFATIAVFSPQSNEPLDGTVADMDGKFAVKSLKPGRYRVEISFIGYESLVQESEINEKGDAANLGSLVLKETAKQLDAIVVSGEKDVIEEKVDRLVYNAEKDATTSGGDAVDVLRRVPMLTVDLDGNVTLRGSQNIKVLIDNRPSMISAGSIAEALKQIPADQIKSVEVITSPSSRYDAEGSGGIINIITKKNNLQGSSLDLRTSTGYRGSNLGANASYRQGRHGITLSGFGRNGYNINGEFTNNQTTTDPDTQETNSVLQHANTSNKMLFGRSNLAYDYEINKYNWISASLSYGGSNTSGVQDNLTSLFYDNDIFAGETLRDVNFVNNSGTMDLNLNYVKSFEKKGKELSFSGLYSNNRRKNNFENILLDIDDETIQSRFRNDNMSFNKEFTVQADYINPILDHTVVEFGGKLITRSVTSDFASYSAAGSDPYQPIGQSELTNVFDYTQQVSGTYFSLTQEFSRDYTLKSGLRYEYTTITADFETNESIDIPSYGVLVPTVNISKKLKKGNMIKLGYNRRIQRPSLQFLNPNVQSNNPNNITQGNPSLDPEFTDNVELGFSTYGKGKSLNLSTFVRNTTGSIQPVRTVLDGDEDVVFTTYDNIGVERSYGLSIFGNINVGEKIQLNGSLDTYYSTLDNQISDPDYHASNSGIVVSGRISGSYKLTDSWTFQVFSFMRGQSVQLQGTQGGFYMYSLNLNKEFKDKRGSIGFGADNPFTRQLNIPSEINSQLVKQESINGMQNMNFKINFRYRLGKMDMNTRTKKRGKSVNNEDLKDRESGNDQPMGNN